MVKEFLEKSKKELCDKKKNIQNLYNELYIKIEEERRFLELLDVESDTALESLSPLNLYSSEKEQYKEHLLKKEEYEKQQKELEVELTEITAKLEELDFVIQHENSLRPNEQEKINLDDIFKLKLLETQENERKRIARDLHDSSVQSLTNLVHRMELCTKLLDLDPIRCRLELMSMSKITKDIINEMRGMIYNLRPMSFDDIGLDVTIEREIDRLKAIADIKIKFLTEGNSYKTKPVIGITLLRIVQEACNNAIKYSKASNITIKIEYHIDVIEISIVDDGIGFEVAEKKVDNSNSGFGLSIMKERIYLLSGKIKIKSTPGKGTGIFVKVPINEEDI